MTTTATTVQSSAHWLDHFQRNAGTRDFGPEAGQVTPQQIAAIAESIREFQLGESGEGSHLMVAAKIHATAIGDDAYPAALRLFIAEEIRHARELKTFMDAHDIAIAKKTAVNRVFRTVRKLAGLELSIAVLVAAEIVAKVYYAALANATGSTHLRNLCQQILRDEADHVRFQSERLAILRSRLPRISLAWRSFLYPLLFRATLLVVWQRHGRAMRAGGYTLTRFWRDSLRELKDATHNMNPRHYLWPKNSPEPPHPSFLLTRFRSIRYALAGISHLLRTQANAWVHLIATLLVIAAGMFLQLKLTEWCWLLAAIGAVWMAEALNTALELLADALQPTHHPLIGRAKDVAAGGVLITALTAAAIGLCVLTPHIPIATHQ